ncbi:hypothetical protein C7H85_16145 [Zobellella endophytica]|uniref:Uncharacterized protein n=2 Tax=Zobellella endophytica TaxID=2116700 RepID=A0A2P7R0M9_9GAMM|nr:hypothetical protein C7H85_16145 [Zobellella endophytica]
MGVPIDPNTQMPVPNNVATTEVVTWVNFKFAEIEQQVLPFIEKSIGNIQKLFKDLSLCV